MIIFRFSFLAVCISLLALFLNGCSFSGPSSDLDSDIRAAETPEEAQAILGEYIRDMENEDDFRALLMRSSFSRVQTADNCEVYQYNDEILGGYGLAAAICDDAWETRLSMNAF